MNEFGIDLPGAKQQNLNPFNSRYPIVAALMNQVSEETLAIAVSKAGGFPSISGYCYATDNDIIDALKKFVDATGKSDVILGVDERSLLNHKLIETIIDLKISHLYRYENEDPKVPEFLRMKWRATTDALFSKLPCRRIQQRRTHDKIKIIDAVHFIKGNDGAGRPGTASTRELFDYHRAETPEALLVPIGGIGTPEQVKYYLDAGAVAVGCGTLFAASQESIISDEAKTAMVKAQKTDLSIVDGNLKQLGLVFKKLDKDTANNTNALKEGIKTAKTGLIFAGHSIDNIKDVDSVSTIINRLMNNIDKY